jgi:hypothetical protein
MKMALDIRNNKMMVQVLSYLQVWVVTQAIYSNLIFLLANSFVNLYFTWVWIQSELF